MASPSLADEVEERQYRMLISGQEAGWMVERRAVADGLLVTDSTMRLDVARGGTAIRMELAERFVETLEHVPVSMRVTQRLGSAPVRTEYVFDGDAIIVEGSQGMDRRPAPSGSWSTPGEVASILSRRVAAVDGSAPASSSFRVRVLEPLLGLDPVTVRYELEAAADAVEIGGERVPASRWRMIQSYAPSTPSTVWLSADGEMLRSEARLMGLEVVTVLAAEPVATEVPPAADLPEILVQTFVHPDRVIEDPRAVRRGVYRLRAEGVGLAKLLPETAVQRVESLVPEDADGAPTAGLRVVVDLDDRASDRAERTERAEPARSGEPAARYLAATNYVDHHHPAVRALLAGPEDADAAPASSDPGSSESGSTDPAERAEELRRVVARHLLSKDLGTALGTAGQAATSQSGDCTEHAVLLAALLRAEGIPSRVAIGLIYAERFAGREDLFGYHMWTQALVDGRWIDLDATLGPETPFDATHLLFGTDALDGDGVPLLSTGLEGLMGRLEIEVESVSPDVTAGSG